MPTTSNSQDNWLVLKINILFITKLIVIFFYREIKLILILYQHTYSTSTKYYIYYTSEMRISSNHILMEGKVRTDQHSTQTFPESNFYIHYEIIHTSSVDSSIFLFRFQIKILSCIPINEGQEKHTIQAKKWMISKSYQYHIF